MGLASCEKQQPSDDNQNNPYNGTKWSYATSGGKEVLHFTSETNVTFYKADVNGNFKATRATGEYSYSGNNISFSNMVEHDGVDYIYENATVSGTTMTLKYYWLKDGEKKYYSPTLMKE